MDNFRVLVVDDETDFLETIVKRLRKRGLEVEGVPKGEAAVEMIKVRRGHERQKDRRQKGSQKGVGHRRGSHRRGSSLDMGQSCGGTHARLLSHVQT
jgi:CheY-like chemotaxis protein